MNHSGMKYSNWGRRLWKSPGIAWRVILNAESVIDEVVDEFWGYDEEGRFVLFAILEIGFD